MPGATTSEVDVSLASNKEFWLLLNEDELFVPCAEFPYFKQATLEQITTVEWPTPNHLYWPMLDIDLTVESIRDPSQFPLIAKRSLFSVNKKSKTSLTRRCAPPSAPLQVFPCPEGRGFIPLSLRERG